MREWIRGQTFECLLRGFQDSTDREIGIRCERCDRMWTALVTIDDLAKAYKQVTRIPLNPAPTTVMARVRNAALAHGLAVMHVCVPLGYHPEIDDAATSEERFEALSVHFAKLAIEASQAVPEPTPNPQLSMAVRG